MIQLSDVAQPGILISNTWPTSRERQGDTLAAIESVLAHGFFEAFQTVEIPISRSAGRLPACFAARTARLPTA